MANNQWDVGILKCVSEAEDRSKLGGDKGSGQVLFGGSFEGDNDGNFEYAGPREGCPLGISKVT